MKNLERYANILEIPFFTVSSFYFVLKPNKTVLEYILMLFVIIGTIADIYFTYDFYLEYISSVEKQNGIQS